MDIQIRGYESSCKIRSSICGGNIMQDEMFMKKLLNCQNWQLSMVTSRSERYLSRMAKLYLATRIKFIPDTIQHFMEKQDWFESFVHRLALPICMNILFIPAANHVLCAVAQWFGWSWDGWFTVQAILIWSIFSETPDAIAQKWYLIILSGNRRFRKVFYVKKVFRFWKSIFIIMQRGERKF